MTLLAVAAGGCGDGHNRPDAATGAPTPEPLTITTRTIPPGQRVRGDGDADNPRDVDGSGDSDSARVGGPDNDNDAPVPASYLLPDRDDRAVFAYGHTANATDRKTVAAVVHRYFAAAAVHNGAAACPLLQPRLMRSLPEDNAGPREPAYVRGRKTCATILTALFAHYGEELTTPVSVIEVRVQGPAAQAIVSSRALPAGRVFLERRSGKWWLTRLLSEVLR